MNALLSPQPKILAFAGSLRVGSFNKKLIRIAAEEARADGAEVTVVDLRDLALPLFDQDLEAAAGLPDNARKLKALMIESDGFLIASPEYNSSVTGVLKNAIDWASRVETPEEPPLVAFRGKTAALLSASPGNLGGLRGLVHLRSILGNIGMIVLPDQVTVPVAHEAFTEAGELEDEAKSGQVAALAETLVTFLQRHKLPVPDSSEL
jgi:NAD(P)H-dependent FMN reductase